MSTPVTQVPTEHTAAFKIFHYIYICLMPAMYLHSDDELENYGVVTTGDRDHDRAMANELTTVQLTISRIAELTDEGVPITLTRPEDSATIYKILQEHLDDWDRNSRSNINLGIVPVDDLRKLELLKSKVADIAKYYIPVRPTMSSFFEKLDAFGGARPKFKREEPVATLNQEPLVKQEVVGGTTPISDAIARFDSKRGKQWG